MGRASVLKNEVKGSDIFVGVIREQAFHELNPKTNTVFTKYETFFLDMPDGRSIELKSVRLNHDLVGSTVKYDSTNNSIALAEGVETSRSGQNTTKNFSNKHILNLNTLVLLAQFENSTPVPASASDYEGLLFTEKNKAYLKRFFGEMSHGKVNITGEVHGWYTFSGNGSDYLRPGNPNNNCFINDDQIQLLANHYSEDLSNYQRVIVITNCEEYGTIGGEYFGQNSDGLGIIRTNGNHTRLGVVGFGGYSTFHDVVWNLVHEMGHSMSNNGMNTLPHSSALDCGEKTIWNNCSSLEYGNPFDAMGHWSGRIFNFTQQHKTGWIDESNILEISESGDYFINNLQTEGGVVGAKIYVPGIVNPIFAVEHRKAQGFDQNIDPNITNGLLLYASLSGNNHWYDNSWRIVDPNPSDSLIYEDLVNDAITDYFYDPVSGVGIEIINITSDGVNFYVTYDTENTICSQEPGLLPATMCPPPYYPQNFNIYQTTNSTGFIATWDMVPEATNYKIQVSINDTFTQSNFYFIDNINNFTSPTLQAENTYFFRIQSCTGGYGYCSDYSPSVSMYIEPIISKPTNLTAVINQDTSLVDLSWQDNSSNETGFLILYCDQPFNINGLAGYSCGGGWGGLNASENSTSLSVPSALDSQSVYYFTIRSYIYNVSGSPQYSDYGNVVSVTTP